jgi:hypothetical protein
MEKKMAKIKTLKILSPTMFFPGSIIELTPDQARDRSHHLKSVLDEKGKIIPMRYEIMRPIQFKKNEIVRFGGNFGKNEKNFVEVVTEKEFTEKLNSEKDAREKAIKEKNTSLADKIADLKKELEDKDISGQDKQRIKSNIKNFEAQIKSVDEKPVIGTGKEDDKLEPEPDPELDDDK